MAGLPAILLISINVSMAMKLLINLVLLFVIAASHSWVERLMVFDVTGKMVGEPGYIRGAVSRMDPRFNDFQMQHILPAPLESEISTADKLCKGTQLSWNYSAALPPLRAKPGAHLALQYQENGHVTLLRQTPQKKDSGMVYIYGTADPSTDDTLRSIHRVWDNQGRGGDRRGRLLAVRPFDDGQCYQINDGPVSVARQTQFPKQPMDPQGADLWCQNDFQLPMDVVEQYTLYWVWDWPTEPNPAAPFGKDEIYTSCIDVEIIPQIEQHRITYQGGQDLNVAGIESQLTTYLN